LPNIIAALNSRPYEEARRAGGSVSADTLVFNLPDWTRIQAGLSFHKIET